MRCCPRPPAGEHPRSQLSSELPADFAPFTLQVIWQVGNQKPAHEDCTTRQPHTLGLAAACCGAAFTLPASDLMPWCGCFIRRWTLAVH